MKKRVRALFIIVLLLVNTLWIASYALADEVKDVTTNEVQKKETTGAQDSTTPQAGDTSSANLGITSKAAVVLEGSTGEVIYAKNKDEKLRPASITKVMTLLLIFDAIDEGKISLTDNVSVSEHAASMGGSQVYLEPYETQTVDTMIKCISICSANDACVAMAEYVAGSEPEFVVRMNEKAKELGMKNTNFVNCCGLDVDNHFSSAYDVALMSRELVMKHPEISNYSTVWMDTITHTTRKGTSEFGLTNTNKLLKTYNGITGLKTGSTSLAKYCLTATATRNDMNMIAVVLAAPETKIRFKECATLLDYGFANCKMYKDDYHDLTFPPMKVVKGVDSKITYHPEKVFNYACLKGKDPANITREVKIAKAVKAPVKEKDKVGEINYYYNGEPVGTVDLVSDNNVKAAKYSNYLMDVLKAFFMGGNK